MFVPMLQHIARNVVEAFDDPAEVGGWFSRSNSDAADPLESAGLTAFDRQRRAGILRGGTLAFVGLGVFLMYRAWILSVPSLGLAIFLTCLAGLANLAWLKRGGSIDRACHAALGLLFGLIVLSVCSTGGFYNPTFGWLFALPIAAATLVGRRGALAWTGLVAATACLLWGLAGAGIELPNRIPIEARHGQALATRLALLFALMLVSGSFALSQRRTERSLVHRNRALQLEAMCVQLLQHAAVAANESDDFDVAIDHSVAQILADANWELALVWEPDPEEASQFRWLERMQHAADPPPPALLEASRRLRIRVGELALGRVLESGRPAWAYAHELEPESSPRGRAAFDAGLTTAIAIPVLVRGHAVRILEFFGRESSPPSERLIEVLCDVGRQLGRVAERVQLQESVRRSQKLESVGQLAAGIAHEISNPMAYVRSNLGTLLEDWREIRDLLKADGDKDEILACLDGCEEMILESQDGVDRTVAIVRDVRDFAREGGAESERILVIDLVESALRFASSAQPEGVTVELDVDPALEFEGLATRMRQVLLNLVMNAMHAMGPGGCLRISADELEDEVLIRVEDDGRGIAEKDLEHVFEPFFTTKSAGQGTGLGLYISHEIARWHGGTIEVESALGRGTLFVVRVPKRRTVA